MNDDQLNAGEHSPTEQSGLAPGSPRSQRLDVPLNTAPLSPPPIAQAPASAPWWTRLLDGDRVWGSMDRSVTRYGLTHYRLVVLPPGIDRVERRLLRGWRAWPTWGVGLWLLSVCLCANLAPWARFALPTIVWLGVGVFLFARVGPLRTQVRTLYVMRMVGDPDPRSAAIFAEMKTLVTMLRSADRLHELGELSTAGHEEMWWQVYDRLTPGHPRTLDDDASI
jgi:hypothetical protein